MATYTYIHAYRDMCVCVYKIKSKPVFLAKLNKITTSRFSKKKLRLSENVLV